MGRSRLILSSVGLLLLLSIVVNLYLFVNLREAEVSIGVLEASLEETRLKIEDSTLADSNEPDLYVHVVGEVQNPGVYCMSAGSRIFEALDSAGGATSDADLLRINMAGTVVDGSQIIVPAIGQEINELDELIASTVQTASEASVGLIDINTAGIKELETLDGIGTKKAETIIAYRNNVGPFKRIEDIMDVSGIGSATFAKIRDYICCR